MGTAFSRHPSPTSHVNLNEKLDKYIKKFLKTQSDPEPQGLKKVLRVGISAD